MAAAFPGIALKLSLLLLLSAGGGAATLGAAGTKDEKPAEIRVEGLGLLQNRKMNQNLVVLLGKERGTTVDANAIEDSAMIVFSKVLEDGFFEPTIEAELTEALLRGPLEPLPAAARAAPAVRAPHQARRAMKRVRRSPARERKRGAAREGSRTSNPSSPTAPW